MNARSEAVDGTIANESSSDFETTFRTHYDRIARVIARVVRDSSRAEDLAVEVFLKLWRNPQAHAENLEGWLYRVAVRKGLDELRSQTRRARYERLFGIVKRVPTPEDVRAAAEGQEKVRSVLAAMQRRQAELLLLRNHGLSYDELASALNLKPASIGTLLSRAQETFRKEYIRRYGEE